MNPKSIIAAAVGPFGMLLLLAVCEDGQHRKCLALESGDGFLDILDVNPQVVSQQELESIRQQVGEFRHIPVNDGAKPPGHNRGRGNLFGSN